MPFRVPSTLDRQLNKMVIVLLMVNAVLLLGEYSRLPSLRHFFGEYRVAASVWNFSLILLLKIIVGTAIFGPFLFFAILTFFFEDRWLIYGNLAVLGAIFLWQILLFLRLWKPK